VKILLVKLSSLGDVLHNLPIVWDIRRAYPDAQLDWLVEEAYVEFLKPLLTPPTFRGIDRIIPLGLRRIKKQWRTKGLSQSLHEFLAQKHTLQSSTYDIVIETQGLFKSAVMTAIAKKTPAAIVAGIGNQTEDSGYEPIARWFYNKSVKVPFHFHAIDRSRAVAAQALGVAIPHREQAPPQFYPRDYLDHLGQLPNPLGLKKQTYVVCFHATARLAKSWQVDHWIALGQWLANHDLMVVFPWGNAHEKAMSERLAQDVPLSVVPKAFSIQEAFVINAQARLVVGVDTGLTHLAAVLQVPTIEMYVDSPKWKTEAYWSPQIINLGDTKSPPSLEQVQTAISYLFYPSSDYPHA
jgi:heptosyltransferase-1